MHTHVTPIDIRNNPELMRLAEEVARTKKPRELMRDKETVAIQILTIEELLHNAEVKMPPQFGTFKQAQRVQQSDALQGELGLSTG
jgi:hypothetical protein